MISIHFIYNFLLLQEFSYCTLTLMINFSFQSVYFLIFSWEWHKLMMINKPYTIRKKKNENLLISFKNENESVYPTLWKSIKLLFYQSINDFIFFCIFFFLNISLKIGPLLCIKEIKRKFYYAYNGIKDRNPFAKSSVEFHLES